MKANTKTNQILSEQIKAVSGLRQKKEKVILSDRVLKAQEEARIARQRAREVQEEELGKQHQLTELPLEDMYKQYVGLHTRVLANQQGNSLQCLYTKIPYATENTRSSKNYVKLPINPSYEELEELVKTVSNSLTFPVEYPEVAQCMRLTEYFKLYGTESKARLVLPESKDYFRQLLSTMYIETLNRLCTHVSNLLDPKKTLKVFADEDNLYVPKAYISYFAHLLEVTFYGVQVLSRNSITR